MTKQPTAQIAPQQGQAEQCHISGVTDAPANMLRFVYAPSQDGQKKGVLTPDLAVRLPGEGIWLVNRKSLVADLAARADIDTASDLAERVEKLMRAHLTSLLSLARKAGSLVSGFGKTEAALSAGRLRLLIGAHDGAADGRHKLMKKAEAAGIMWSTLLSSDELGMALGRANVIHAGLTDVGWAERFQREAGRLAAYLGDIDGRMSE